MRLGEVNGVSEWCYGSVIGGMSTLRSRGVKDGVSLVS